MRGKLFILVLQCTGCAAGAAQSSYSDFASQAFASFGISVVMGKKAQKRTAQEKSDAVKKDLRKLADSGVKKTEKENVESMVGWLTTHPRACAHLLQLCILQKSYDHLDNPEAAASDAEEEKLPEWCNKLRLLNTSFTIGLLQEMLPRMSEWLGEIKQPKMKKDVANEVLGFITNCDPTSAVPSKKVAELKAWCHAEHKKHGLRLSKFEPPDECTALEDWSFNRA